jgi:hypothetical protein
MPGEPDLAPVFPKPFQRAEIGPCRQSFEQEKSRSFQRLS